MRAYHPPPMEMAKNRQLWFLMSAPTRSLLRLLCALSVAALLLAVAVPVRSGTAPGERLAPFALPDADGGMHHWRPGRVTVLSFCAFWCDTWREQQQRIDACRQALRGLPVDFLTISVDGRWAERGRGQIVGRVLLDHGGAFSASRQVRAVPYTVVVDARGKVCYAAQGIVRAAILQAAVREAITGGEAPPAGTVYLTFDDFPAGETDEELLDILRAHRVRATFFCIGSHVAGRAAIVRRAAGEGHSVQLHGWDHDAADPQLARCTRALKEVTQVSPALYRPPGSPDIRRLDGTPVPAHVVNPYDYTRPGEREIVRRVLPAARPGSVLLLHAGVADTRRALPQIIAGLRSRGFSFGMLQ